MNFLGLRIVKSPMAVKDERVAAITRSHIKKRRRGWVLRYSIKETPCAFTDGSTVYAHPDIYAAILEAHK